METDKKKGWKSQSGFIWAVLGSVVGFANILSFSSQCYQNGGGAFLIPYFIAYLVLGIPMLFLEGLIGQKMQMPLVSAYGNSSGRIGKFFGWIAILSCLTIGSFYIVLTSYSALYTFFGAALVIPSDSAHFFQNTFLHSTQSIEDFGFFAWNIFITVLLIGGLVWWTLIRDISKGIEKICSLVMPLLTFIVILFAVITTFLPGAMIGIRHLITPDFAALSDLRLWRDVFGQLFFSLSLGLGIITGYSQYNKGKINLKKAMKWVAIGDFVISFIAGWVIFACIGYLSYAKDVPFNEIIKTNSAFEIGFIIFPKILHTFSPFLQSLMGTIFFFCIFIAGITGIFSIVESLAGNFEKEFLQSRKKAVSYSIGSICVLSLLFCMGNGQILIGALAPMVLGLNMILSALAEIIVFLFISKAVRDDIMWNKNGKKQLYYYSLKIVVPIILLAIFIGAIIAEMEQVDTAVYLRWLWFAIASCLSYFFIQKAEESISLRDFALDKAKSLKISKS